ncbi:MAG: hypothetical protein UW11_C0037G0010, partial [Parcubacteria group bacterium GW2011_GWA2_43_9b]
GDHAVGQRAGVVDQYLVVAIGIAVAAELVFLEVAEPARTRSRIRTEHTDIHLVFEGALGIHRNRQRSRGEHAIDGLYLGKDQGHRILDFLLAGGLVVLAAADLGHALEQGGLIGFAGILADIDGIGGNLVNQLGLRTAGALRVVHGGSDAVGVHEARPLVGDLRAAAGDRSGDGADRGRIGNPGQRCSIRQIGGGSRLIRIAVADEDNEVLGAAIVGGAGRQIGGGGGGGQRIAGQRAGRLFGGIDRAAGVIAKIERSAAGQVGGTETGKAVEIAVGRIQHAVIDDGRCIDLVVVVAVAAEVGDHGVEHAGEGGLVGAAHLAHAEAHVAAVGARRHQQSDIDVVAQGGQDFRKGLKFGFALLGAGRQPALVGRGPVGRIVEHDQHIGLGAGGGFAADIEIDVFRQGGRHHAETDGGSHGNDAVAQGLVNVHGMSSDFMSNDRKNRWSTRSPRCCPCGCRCPG